MFKRRQRLILHSDLNNFYASVECLLNPKIKNDAVIVVGDEELRHGVVLAKNSIAKQIGIKTGDTVFEAEQKCSGNIKLTKLKARLWLYQKISRNVQKIYRKYTDNVEMFGIDEAWLDMTATVKDYTEALEIAEQIRCEIKDTIGLTVSIGVSYNKIFAKLGSDLKKPDAITLITRGNFKDRIWPLPVNTLLLIGRSTTDKLKKMNISTIGDLAQTKLSVLENLLGIIGKRLWEYANGLDCSPVTHVNSEQIMKSIGNSLTYPKDLTTIQDVTTAMYNLAEQVSARLKAENLYCKEIQIYVKDNELRSIEHQCKLSTPTDTASSIAQNAIKLFTKTCTLDTPIRALGIRLRDFSNILQTSLLDEINIVNQEKIDIAIEKIRKKYGENSIARANNLFS